MAVNSESMGGAGSRDRRLPAGVRARSSSILLIEDSLAQAAVYTAFLNKAGYAVEHAPDGEQALAILAARQPDLVVLDLFLPGIQGMDVLRQMRREGRNQPVIVITDQASVDLAVQAMQEGAYDFVTKPFDANRIRITVENALRQHKLANTIETYRESFDRKTFRGFVGASLPMQTIYRIVESAAKSKATIFITGESGTGKEICAAALHAESPRADRPFIAINCAAIPNSLMESEIFGHVKGAFTGADRDRPGAAMLADGGTLFFDEICDMDLELQAKLLRFVQTGIICPVGSNKECNVDVRFICATNRDPLEAVSDGRFREDLYYRLHVMPIALPALRDHADDIGMIARHILLRVAADEGKRFSRLSSGAEEIMRDYAWPGNVRQLENVIRGIVVLCDGDVVTSAMIPAPVNQGSAASDVAGSATSTPPRHASAARDDAGDLVIRSLREIEKESIENAIHACGGNVPKAAVMLGVSPSTLYRKRRSWIDATRLTDV